MDNKNINLLSIIYFLIMKQNLIIFSLLFLSYLVVAQSKTTISGYIKDAESNESLIGANIINAKEHIGTTTNSYGFFSISVNAGIDSLKVSYVGYNSIYLKVKDITGIVEIKLHQGNELEEIVVRGSNSTSEAKRMTAKTILNLPVVLGESDIIRTIQLMPGVVSGTEATSGFFVRGGNSDQNLLLIDGTPIYNSYHMFGLFSVFNSDAINNATFYSGNMPAQYGGRLSSVMDIALREGNSKKISGEMMLGTFTSKFLLEGPIVNEKTSFLITGRRSILDIAPQSIQNIIILLSGMNRTQNEAQRIDQYMFYDINFKINHQFSSKSKLFLNWYKGNDSYNPQLQTDYRNSFDFGNQAFSLRYNQVLAKNLYANITIYNSNYHYKNSRGEQLLDSNNTVIGGNVLESYTGISDYCANFQIDNSFAKHFLKYGVQYLNQTLTPGITTYYNGISDTTFRSVYSNNNLNVFFSDDYSVKNKFTFTYGLRSDFTFTKTKTYARIQPRLKAKYLVNDRLFFKASYSRTSQNIHQLSFSTNGAPSDMWVPATSNVKPATADEFALGTNYVLTKDILISIDVYSKQMHDIIMYKEGASYLGENRNWQEMIVSGKGKSNGLELFLKKEHGKSTGWISYTLSKTTRQFNAINQGKEFPFTFDRTHNFNIAIMQKLGKHWDFGSSWMYATGYALTLSKSAFYTIDPFGDVNHIKQYGSKNSSRMPDFHRLDVCFNYNQTTKYFKYKFNIGAYNVYGRQNPYYVVESGGRAIPIGLFKTLPYCGIAIKF